MDDLYRDYILEHYKRPHNFGELDPHDLEALEHNPLCGDELGVHIKVEDGRIADLRFHGHGCAISQASASIASEELIGMELEEVGGLDADWMIELLGIPVSATRRKCALLNLKVVRGAVTGDNSWPVSGTEAESLRGSATSSVSDEEIIEPVDIEWEATGARDTIPSPEHGIRKPPRSEESHGHD